MTESKVTEPKKRTRKPKAAAPDPKKAAEATAPVVADGPVAYPDEPRPDSSYPSSGPAACTQADCAASRSGSWRAA